MPIGYLVGLSIAWPSESLGQFTTHDNKPFKMFYFNSKPFSSITFVTPKNCFELLEWVLRLFVTCSQQKHLVWERKGCKMWDVLGPLNELEELLIGCLANVGHCWLKTHSKNCNQSQLKTVGLSQWWLWRMPSSGIWRRVDPVKWTNVPPKCRFISQIYTEPHPRRWHSSKTS
jgi:hypothetical protein